MSLGGSLIIWAAPGYHTYREVAAFSPPGLFLIISDSLRDHFMILGCCIMDLLVVP